MDVIYKTRKLSKRCNSIKEATKTWGAHNAVKIVKGLNELRAAESLADLFKLPHLRCHQLKGNRKDQFAVTAHGLLRIVFVPAEDPLPKTPDGGIDLKNVTTIEIVSIEDYHGE